MTTHEKRMFRFHIVRNDMQNRFDFAKNFFALDMVDICRLDHYAEVFGIKADAEGRSRARVLWMQLQKCYEEYMNL